MTPRERADEIIAWYSSVVATPFSNSLRDHIEAAIIAATEDADARAEAAEKALAELNKVAKTMAGSYTSGQDGGP